MNRSDLIEIMSGPAPLTRQMIGEVAELIELFPYFQSAHLLLLKGLHDTSDVKFESQLRKSAVHIADREVLYYLLKRSDEINPGEPTGEKVAETDKESFTDNQQTVIESAKSSDDYIEKLSFPNVADGQSLSDEAESVHSILVSTESEYDESAVVMFIGDDESEPAEERIIYMDPGFSISDQPDLLELENDEMDRQADLDEFVISESSTFERDEKKIQEELIDIFIASNPRIEPNKERSYQPPDDFSKPFITELEQEGFVTETLAKIYIKQEYYSKAIDIYEKLSLKFPEKISYFASQIEIVKELLKK